MNHVEGNSLIKIKQTLRKIVDKKDEQNYLHALLHEPADIEYDLDDVVEVSGPTVLPYMRLQVYTAVQKLNESVCLDQYVKTKGAFVFDELSYYNFDLSKQVDKDWYEAMLQNSLRQ